jgi:hypothetical protein
LIKKLIGLAEGFTSKIEEETFNFGLPSSKDFTFLATFGGKKN